MRTAPEGKRFRRRKPPPSSWPVRRASPPRRRGYGICACPPPIAARQMIFPARMTPSAAGTGNENVFVHDGPLLVPEVSERRFWEGEGGGGGGGEKRGTSRGPSCLKTFEIAGFGGRGSPASRENHLPFRDGGGQARIPISPPTGRRCAAERPTAWW